MYKYTVKVLEQVAPQEYMSTVIYRTDDIEVAESVAYEHGGYIEEEEQINRVTDESLKIKTKRLYNYRRITQKGGLQDEKN